MIEPSQPVRPLPTLPEGEEEKDDRLLAGAAAPAGDLSYVAGQGQRQAVPPRPQAAQQAAQQAAPAGEALVAEAASADAGRPSEAASTQPGGFEATTRYGLSM